MLGKLDVNPCIRARSGAHTGASWMFEEVGRQSRRLLHLAQWMCHQLKLYALQREQIMLRPSVIIYLFRTKTF